MRILVRACTHNSQLSADRWLMSACPESRQIADGSGGPLCAIRVINAVQQISTGLPSYLGLWSARWHPPGRRTVKTEPLSGSLATVMSPAHHARELARERKAEPGAPEYAP
jgi:hypothetical protein